MQTANALCLFLALSGSAALADPGTDFIGTALNRAAYAESQESHLRDLIATHPGNAGLLLRLGALLGREQRWPEARLAYARADELAAGQADTLYNLAVCLDHLEQTGAAIRHYRKALELAAEQAHNFPQAMVRQRLSQLQAALP